MKFKIQPMKIKDLIAGLKNDVIDLRPPFSRFNVWSSENQLDVIKYIQNGYPLQAFTLIKVSDEKFIMVDGQNRTIAINRYYDMLSKKDRKYKITTHILDYCEEDEYRNVIHSYHTRPSAFHKSNKISLYSDEKSSYYKLVTELTQLPAFKDLNLFERQDILPVNDFDVVAEIVKLMVDQLQLESQSKEDILEKDYNICKSLFKSVLLTLTEFNRIYPLNETRFKSKADFYTLFQLLLLDQEHKIGIDHYRVILFFSIDISPSNSDSPIHRTYGENCIKSPHSPEARANRFNILTSLFGYYYEPNFTQQALIDFYREEYNIDLSNLKVVAENQFTFDISGEIFDKVMSGEIYL